MTPCDRDTAWQDVQLGAWDLPAIWAPVGITVETINLQFTAAPSPRGVGFSCSVLFGMAFKIPSQKSVLGQQNAM